MEFFHRAQRAERKRPATVGVFPGTFNPITVAHLEIARAALAHVEEVVLVLPRVFPHKDYAGASFEDRMNMMRAAVAPESGISVATADGGLFVEIAREFRAAYGSDIGLQFLCGRDAAERIVRWDYGRPGVIGEMLREFGLLVAGRGGSIFRRRNYRNR
jgi:cytidyltransferase-like protein